MLDRKARLLAPLLARAQAKAKMRQPLAKAVIVATESERRVIDRFADVVTPTEYAWYLNTV